MAIDRHEQPSSTPPLVAVAGLCKHYPEFTLSDVSFSVEAGSITGFIGRNGAGKSTTLKCLEGSVHPDAGSIAYFGAPFAGHEEQAKRRIGFELGGADFYRTKKVAQIARVTRRFYDDWDEAAYARYCKLFNINQDKRVKELSQGMRVKFTLALALSHRSQLLVLDEPTSGLDPASREEVLDIFLTLARQQGTGVLFSTHITSDLDKCADSIVYINNGRIVGSGSLQAFKDAYRVVPLDQARSAGVPVLGTRLTAAGGTALVSATEGIGSPATLDDIMTHTNKEAF